MMLAYNIGAAWLIWMSLLFQEDLGMEVPPRRIEAFDNSNIQGSNPVSVLVCFIDGKPKVFSFYKMVHRFGHWSRACNGRFGKMIFFKKLISISRGVI